MQMDLIHILILLIIIVISMVFHEISHAYVSYWLGDYTARDQGRLSLNPVRHLDPFISIILPLVMALSGGPIFGGAKPVPYNPHNLKWGDWGVLAVAVVGPLSNLLLAFLGFGALVIFNSSMSQYFGDVLGLFMSVNLGLFVFNLIPIPPLDGSRVIYALAPDFVRGFMERIEQFGMFIVLGLVLLAGPWLASYIYAFEGHILWLFKIIFMVN